MKNLLFATLRSALFGTSPPVEEYKKLAPAAWGEFFVLSVRQEVAAIVGDVVLQTNLMPRQIKVQWIAAIGMAQQRCQQQQHATHRLLQFLNPQGIRTMVLKGYGVARYYPKPILRPSKDLDIYHFGEWRKADQLLHKQLHIDIHDEGIHHTKYLFHGVTVENHYDFVGNRNLRSNLRYEALLKSLANQDVQTVVLGKEFDTANVNIHSQTAAADTDPKNKGIKIVDGSLQTTAETIPPKGENYGYSDKVVGGSSQPATTSITPNREQLLYLPNATFEALFLMRHLSCHFASDNITVRHLCDWAMFLTQQRDAVDWQMVSEAFRCYGMMSFVGALQCMAEDHLGLPPLPQLPRSDRAIQQRVEQALFSPPRQSPKENLGRLLWKIRRFKSNTWKYRLTTSDSIASILLHGTITHLRHPHTILHKV